MGIIAISRGSFSGGEALARGVAEQLGYRCVSREVILEAGWAYGQPAEKLLSAMEKRPSLWERAIGRRRTYLTYVQAALCEHAQGGNLVYHGYLGHMLLPGVSHVLRVRVIADMEYRIRAAMQQQRLGREAARQYIERVDKERRQWTQFLYDVDWNDPRLYDLVVNLSRIPLPAACPLVIQVMRSEAFQPTAASVRAMQDLVLSSRVAAELARDPRTASAHLQVRTDGGVVIVTGTTQSPALRDAVPSVARHAQGVRDFRNEVRFLREGSAVPQ